MDENPDDENEFTEWLFFMDEWGFLSKTLQYGDYTKHLSLKNINSAKQ